MPRLAMRTLVALVAVSFSAAICAAQPLSPQWRGPARAFPTDPTGDLDWTVGMSSVSDIQSAFTTARNNENSQLGKSIPAMPSLPSQSVWDSMTPSRKALWLINRERLDRGVQALQDVESNVTSVAQTYAQFLLDNNVFNHTANGQDPWQRLGANPAIGACRDPLSIAENLAVFVTTGSSIPLPVERSIYDWMYSDQGSAWGHRHAILWFPYNDNSGSAGQEGFLGIGIVSGGPYQGPFTSPAPLATIGVMNVFDPCATWAFRVFLPLIRK